MSNSSATVSIDLVCSGSPAYLDLPNEAVAKWPVSSGSTMLISSLFGSVLTIMVSSRRETVFLTRAHQRVMDRALRRSVRIID